MLRKEEFEALRREFVERDPVVAYTKSGFMYIDRVEVQGLSVSQSKTLCPKHWAAIADQKSKGKKYKLSDDPVAEASKSRQRSGGSGSTKLRMFTCQLRLARRDVTGWAASELAAFDAALAGDPEPLGEVLLDRLTEAGMQVSDAYVATHDEDVYTIEDYMEDSTHVPGHPKPVHLHFWARSADKKGGMTIASIAEALGVPENQVEKPHTRGRYAWDNMISYPTHVKYKDKTQYPPTIVHTLVGADYQLIWVERHEDRAKGAASIDRKELRSRVDWLQQQVVTGELTLDDVMASDALYAVYSVSKSAQAEIDAAADAYAKRRMYRSVAALRRGEFHTVTVWLFGGTGVGKDVIAGQVAGALADCLGWRVCDAASSNALDDYAGEEILYIEEARSSVMDWANWLKLSNPYKASRAAARYRNKPVMKPRLILITTPLLPPDLFLFMSGVGNNPGDSVSQGMRRLALVADVGNPRGKKGYMSVDMRQPMRCEPYQLAYVVRSRGGQYVEHATATVCFPDTGVRVSPYRLAHAIIDAVAASTGDGVDVDGLRDAVDARLFERYADIHAAEVAAVAPSPMPALPAPDADEGERPRRASTEWIGDERSDSHRAWRRRLAAPGRTLPPATDAGDEARPRGASFADGVVVDGEFIPR